MLEAFGMQQYDQGSQVISEHNKVNTDLSPWVSCIKIMAISLKKWLICIKLKKSVPRSLALFLLFGTAGLFAHDDLVDAQDWAGSICGAAQCPELNGFGVQYLLFSGIQGAVRLSGSLNVHAGVGLVACMSSS